MPKPTALMSGARATMFNRLLLVLWLMIAACPTSLAAQAPDPSGNARQVLDRSRQELDAIDQALDGRLERADRQALRERAAKVASDANEAIATLQTQQQLVDARSQELGPVAPGTTEPPDIRALRRLLQQQHATLDSEIKRGRLLVVDANQLGDEITASEAEQFNQRMSTRTVSPASPAFWDAVLKHFPRDSRRAILFVSAGTSVFVAGLGSSRGWIGIAGLLIAFALLIPARAWLRRIGRRYVIEKAPESGIRRSGYALWLVLTGTFAAGLAASVLVQALRWANMLSPGWDAVAGRLIHVAFVVGAIIALGGALLQRHHPAWRMVALSDEAASRLRRWTWIAAAVTAVSLLLMRANDAIGVSGPASAAADAAVALAYQILIAGILITSGRLRASSMRGIEPGAVTAERTGVTAASLVGWLAVLASFVALLLGYLNLARFVAFMVVWITIVVAATYLLLNAANAMSLGLFSRHSRIGRSAHYGLGIRESVIDQVGVLLSAFLRLLLITVALGMMLMPFGTDVGSLFGTIWALAQGVTIGQITISPGAILRAVTVLALGMFLVRLLQGWLTASYLPTTELDPSARNSISMIARYTGIVLAVLWAVASLGIGLERIGLLLSALSVGIGFGLQAITQNFVSGLILLAERPVKIGDWIRIGDQEGDVKRISVRATEIQVADRSTLIVPNSELITKTIQNMTLTDPIGRMQLQFSVTLGTDPAQVRQIMQDIFVATPKVLDDPAPAIYIDTIADGRILFNCFAYVASPRDVYSARSAILFDMLTRFAAEKIDIGTTAQRLEVVAPDGQLRAPPPEPPVPPPAGD